MFDAGCGFGIADRSALQPSEEQPVRFQGVLFHFYDILEFGIDVGGRIGQGLHANSKAALPMADSSMFRRGLCASIWELSG